MKLFDRAFKKLTLNSKLEKIILIGAALSMPAMALQKTFETKETNPERYNVLKSKIQIPPFFALPRSATNVNNVPNTYEFSDATGSDELFYLEHPKSTNSSNPIGLRLYIAERTPDVARRLARSGFVKDGDVIVSFRPDWGTSGPYTQAQMGQTHAGLAYIENGVVKNVEHPLDFKFLLPNDILGTGDLVELENGDLAHPDPSNVHKTQPMVHIFRPRTSVLAQDKVQNFKDWAKLLRSRTRVNPAVNPFTSIFTFIAPSEEHPEAGYGRVGFNMDYLAPKLKRGETHYNWIKDFMKITLGSKRTPRVNMFCSELVWSFLSMIQCNPNDFDVSDKENINIPDHCVKPAFEALPMVGDYFLKNRSSSSQIGLGEGTLMVIDSMNLEKTERNKLIDAVFAEAQATGNLSAGQVQVSGTVEPSFVQIKDYYTGIFEPEGSPERIKAEYLRNKFNLQEGETMPDGSKFTRPRGADLNFLDNYSPTAFGINSYLPEDNEHRAFDYVGTVVYKDVLGE